MSLNDSRANVKTTNRACKKKKVVSSGSTRNKSDEKKKTFEKSPDIKKTVEKSPKRKKAFEKSSGTTVNSNGKFSAIKNDKIQSKGNSISR
jgi:hypothetical protein